MITPLLCHGDENIYHVIPLLTRWSYHSLALSHRGPMFTTLTTRPLFPAGTITSRQCGSEDLVLTCPQNQHILIHDVFYGRRNGSICPSATGVGNNILCDPKSSQPMEVAGFLCNGRQSCNLYPGNPPYDDPCPDIMTNRYLEASYTCERKYTGTSIKRPQGW